jgi:hypothetical protein
MGGIEIIFARTGTREQASFKGASRPMNENPGNPRPKEDISGFGGELELQAVVLQRYPIQMYIYGVVSDLLIRLIRVTLFTAKVSNHDERQCHLVPSLKEAD